MDATPGTVDQPLTWRGSFLARLPGGRRSYWLVVAGAAAITGLAVAVVAGMARGDPSLGELTPVVVAIQTIEAGQPLDEGNTETRQYPEQVLPPDAVPALSGVEVASASLHVGDVVTASRLGGIPIGDRIEVAVPAHTAIPLVAPGDRVDVLVTLPISDETGSQTQATLTVANSAVVTALAEHAVTIAVTEQELLPVASAVIQGSITLALVQSG